MSTLLQKGVTEPDFTSVLRQLKADIFSTLHCVKVGKIASFDGTKKTAQVQLLFKRVIPGGTIQSYPLLVDCPVFTLQGGGGAVQMPIAAGDQCLVLFSDRRLDEWFQNGGEAAPATARMHDLSDGIVLVGLNALNSALASYPANFVRLSYGASEIDLKSGELDLISTLVKISNGSTTLLTLVQNLIVAIEGIQVTGNLPLTAASVTALEAVKAQFATLLL